MMIDGFNSQLSDIDFYDQAKKTFEDADIKTDVTFPHYFKRNPFLKKFNSYIPYEFTEWFKSTLHTVLTELLDVKRGAYYRGEFSPFLDTLKN